MSFTDLQKELMQEERDQTIPFSKLY